MVIRLTKSCTLEEETSTRRWKQNLAVQTVASILRNEKYKVTLYYKRLSRSIIWKRERKSMKQEVPRYYVENSHEAIIKPEEWKWSKRRSKEGPN